MKYLNKVTLKIIDPNLRQAYAAHYQSNILWAALYLIIIRSIKITYALFKLYATTNSGNQNYLAFYLQQYGVLFIQCIILLLQKKFPKQLSPFSLVLIYITTALGIDPSVKAQTIDKFLYK